MLSSARRGIQYPNPDRSDRPDVPTHILNLVNALEADVVFIQGLDSDRLAHAHQSGGGQFWWTTDTLVLWYDDGVAWRQITIAGYADKNSASQQAFTAEVQVPDLKVTGLTGAAQATRYVGATTSGAPGSGTFQVGDFIIDRSGAVWVCTAGGTPGTWVVATMPPTQRIIGGPASGTYNRPTGVRAILIECIAAGGGGGGAGAGGNGLGCVGVGGGGAAGQYVCKLIANPNASYAYVVGGGGGGGAPTPVAGAAGGDTTFGATVVVAKGGAGGPAGSAQYVGTNNAGADGSGTGGVGDIVVPGGGAGMGVAFTLGSGSSSRLAFGGNGGGSYFGSGGCGAAGNGGNAPGRNAAPSGAGGGGAALIDGGFGTGGNGGNGILIVTEYY